ncbi:DUF2752 domain-containing protein [Streptomyces sp. TRM 70361]|uniref:DUF2752 domain-containing protein n=1 Tax=Streptomyces sp. TRM 70361 TaxID=3116553 RepID=UPI002E7C134A|nr:DUF2752 domain-containing protein [Streptomyces sp. TRM 70361]MEE1941403.1 DUF2752 domain-containing protein [Streptomyces sp. TRM 70361]
MSGPVHGPGDRARTGAGRSVRAARTARLLRTLRTARTHPATPPLTALAAGLGAAGHLWNTDPHRPGQWLPRCPFNVLTGLLCPACGGTRLAYDLLHGDLVAAFHDNALLLVLGVPAAAYLGGRWLVAGLRGRRWRPSAGRRGVLGVAVVAAVWTLARNLAG